VRARGVFLKASPVAFVSEGLALRDAQSGEESPAVQKARLSRRKAHLLDGQKFVVVKDDAMEHSGGLPAQRGKFYLKNLPEVFLSAVPEFWSI
jgi:hypothetical protein